jgi:hypothetical protein
MGNAPRIWLDYRPVRIGWIVDEPALAQLATAASWSTCLWGGRFNPIIPLQDRVLSDKLIQIFQVDVLIPIVPSAPARAFVASYPHLHLNLHGDGIFKAGYCDFIDVRHPAKRATEQLRDQAGDAPAAIVRPVWSDADELSPFFAILFGRYPKPAEITLDYVGGIRNSLIMPDKSIEPGAEVPADLMRSVSPVSFTAFNMFWRRTVSGKDIATCTRVRASSGFT